MKNAVAYICLSLSLLAPSEVAMAKGCIKGAIIGGIAGHYAGRHGVIGTVGGCLYGRHLAHKNLQTAKPYSRDAYGEPGWM